MNGLCCFLSFFFMWIDLTWTNFVTFHHVNLLQGAQATSLLICQEKKRNVPTNLTFAKCHCFAHIKTFFLHFCYLFSVFPCIVVRNITAFHPFLKKLTNMIWCNKLASIAIRWSNLYPTDDFEAGQCRGPNLIAEGSVLLHTTLSDKGQHFEVLCKKENTSWHVSCWDNYYFDCLKVPKM